MSRINKNKSRKGNRQSKNRKKIPSMQDQGKSSDAKSNPNYLLKKMSESLISRLTPKKVKDAVLKKLFRLNNSFKFQETNKNKDINLLNFNINRERFANSYEKSSNYIPYKKLKLNMTKDDIKLLAFYLPQFHPIPENDAAWGIGFTEWTNVTRAVPVFRGHYQPRLPGDLGFYDLRIKEIMYRQIDLAKNYGIYGFCFHHYWLNGKPVMRTPIDNFITDKNMNFPFCLHWANEPWTYKWDGTKESGVILDQKHTPEDDLAFIRDTLRYFKDKRYIRINGRPLFLIYRFGLFPNIKETIKRWTRECEINEVKKPYFVMVQTGYDGIKNPEDYGFDAAAEFPPHFFNLPNIKSQYDMLFPDFEGNIFDYREASLTNMSKLKTSYKLFRGIMLDWDCTARKIKSHIYAGSTPKLYQNWLEYHCKFTQKDFSTNERFIFINAWNEWAEGTHLEPDKKFGYAYLQATADALENTKKFEKGKKIILSIHDAHPHGSQLIALNILKILKNNLHFEIVVLLKESGVLEKDFKKYSKLYCLESDYNTEEKKISLINSLKAEGFSNAICNTVMTGDLLTLLEINGIKSISLIHELPGFIKKANADKFAKSIAKNANKIIFADKFVAKQFNSNFAFKKDKKVILPQGLYHKNTCLKKKTELRDQLRKSLGLESSSKIVLNVGYADERKGIDIFLRIAENTTIYRKDIHFVWVGNKEHGYFNKHYLLLNEHIKRNVHFVEFKDDVSLYYAGADLFLLTSREDPFPTVLLEAMEAGLPIVGFKNAGGFGKLVTKKTGVLVPYLNENKMKEALLKTIDDVNFLKKVNLESPKIIEESYNFKDYVYSLLDLLDFHFKKISVIIPNFNHQKFIAERINSILTQTYPIYEIIFLDDVSEDKSFEIAHKLLYESGLDVDYIYNEKRSGTAFKQWIKGIRKVKGKYIWIAESDDVSDKNFLEEVVKGFDNPKIVLSYCQSKQIDENGSIIAENYLDYTSDFENNKWIENYTNNGINEIKTALYVKNTIPNVSSVIFKKIDFSKIENELIKMYVAGDWLFYIYLLEHGDISFSSNALNYHRRHDKSSTKIATNKIHLNEIIKMQDQVIKKYNLPKISIIKAKKYRQKVSAYLNLRKK